MGYNDEGNPGVMSLLWTLLIGWLTHLSYLETHLWMDFKATPAKKREEISETCWGPTWKKPWHKNQRHRASFLDTCPRLMRLTVWTQWSSLYLEGEKIPGTRSVLWCMGVGASCCGAVLLQEESRLWSVSSGPDRRSREVLKDSSSRFWWVRLVAFLANRNNWDDSDRKQNKFVLI